jgi:hypothetical protein
VAGVGTPIGAVALSGSGELYAEGIASINKYDITVISAHLYSAFSGDVRTGYANGELRAVYYGSLRK